jgi:hypothetical protein
MVAGMRRRLALIAAAVLTAAASIFVVHDIVLFDGDRFLQEWAEALSAQASGNDRGGELASIDETEFVERARWHQGERPCFTYFPPRASPESVRTVADDIVAAGVLSQARATFSLWAHWAALDERERHGGIRDEEALAVFNGAGWRRRLLITLNRGKVVAAVQRSARTRDAELAAQVAAQESQLAPNDVRAARAFWRAHRLALPAEVLFELRPELDRRAEPADAAGRAPE